MEIFLLRLPEFLKGKSNKMNLEDIEVRKEIGESLINVFTAEFDSYINASSNKELSFRDMEEISKSMKEEVAPQYGFTDLPLGVINALDQSVEMLDPNNISDKKKWLNYIFLVIGIIGLYFITTGIFDYMSHGEDRCILVKWWYSLRGEKKEFPFRVIPGIALLAISLYGVGHRETPAERSVKCKRKVVAAIEDWIKTGN